MKKVLVINTVPFGMGGMSAVITNYLKNMNKDNMEITMIVNSRIEKEYEDILKLNGIKIIILKRNYKLIRYIYQLHKVMKQEKFDVIHVHGNSSTMAFESVPAYLNRIPIRIMHCHNVTCTHKILNKILWPFLKNTYTLGVACSKEAGEWLFKDKKEFIILNNAINLEKYQFDENSRVEVRKSLGLENDFVVGHVGYFNDQKNHEKLFEIVSYLKNKIDVKLLCISGSAEIPDKILEMIKKYQLENNIKILLKRNDVNRLLQGMDCFVFPSKFEGLGLALVEAQATGINCFASDKVPKAAAICEDLVNYCNLESNSSEWGNLILDINKNHFKSRKDRCSDAMIKLKESSYDICIEAEKLREIYIK